MKNLDIYSNMIKELNQDYVDEINPGELTQTGINAMLESLDPYTNFIPESQVEDYKFCLRMARNSFSDNMVFKTDGRMIFPFQDKHSTEQNSTSQADYQNETLGQNPVVLLTEKQPLISGQHGQKIPPTIGIPVSNPRVTNIQSDLNYFTASRKKRRMGASLSCQRPSPLFFSFPGYLLPVRVLCSSLNILGTSSSRLVITSLASGRSCRM